MTPSNINLTKILCWIIAGALLFALAPLPIGYYTLLRFVVCLLSLYFVYTVYQQEKKISTSLLIFILIAIIFNPIKPLYFSKEVWRILDISGTLWFLWYGLKKA